MNRRWLAVAVAVWLMMGGVSQAGMKQLVLRVDGLACPFCAYGLEKKLMALPGVTSYDADLREGKVFVGLEPSASVDMEQVQEAVKKGGFTLRSITLTASGTLTETADGWMLDVNDADQFLLVSPERLGPQLEDGVRQGQVVEVTGVLQTRETGPPELSIEDIRPVGQTVQDP